MPDGPRAGIAALVTACTIWGLSPLIYKALAEVPATDVLAQRTVWSAVLFGALVAMGGRWGQMTALARDRRTAVIVALAAVMISVNWLVFIFAVQSGLTVEASLGYYVYPLIMVLLGRVLFGEGARALQWAAIALAATGVAILTLGLGAVPWISLLLAGSFATYGVLKRVLDAHPMVSVTAEVMILLPPAIAWTVWRDGAGFFTGVPEALLLVSLGPVTAVPLMLFTYAARHLKSATVGIMFYLNPTLQFLLGTVLFGERFTAAHAIAFPLIWIAVGLYSFGLWQTGHAARAAGRKPREAAPVEG